MIFNNKLYDILAYISRYAIPAFTGLYYALADIWSLPYGTQVLATGTALTVCLNILLGISSIEYNKSLKDQKDNDNGLSDTLKEIDKAFDAIKEDKESC